MLNADDFYHIDEHTQAKTIQEKNILCQLQKEAASANESHSSQSSLGHCPIDWDGLMCWQATAANTAARQPCPFYVNNFYKHGFAVKTCLSSGVWQSRAETNRTWTNYSGCQIQLHEYTNIFYGIHFMGNVGYFISLISLLVAIIILLGFRRLRCDRNRIHVHFFAVLALKALIVFIDVPLKQYNVETWICKLVDTCSRYMGQAAYTWVFVEALYLHNIVFVHVLRERSFPVECYMVLGWCLPIPIIITRVILRCWYDQSYCWLNTDRILKTDLWLFIIYPTILTLVNFAFFLHLVRFLFAKVNEERLEDRKKYRKLSKSIFVLITVFGLYEIAFIPIDIYTIVKPHKSQFMLLIKLFLDLGISSFEGFIVAVLFCFSNTEVINEITTLWNQSFLRSRPQDNDLRRFSRLTRVPVSIRTDGSLALGNGSNSSVAATKLASCGTEGSHKITEENKVLLNRMSC